MSWERRTELASLAAGADQPYYGPAGGSRRPGCRRESRGAGETNARFGTLAGEMNARVGTLTSEMSARVGTSTSQTNARLDTLAGAILSLQREMSTLRWTIWIGCTLVSALLAILTLFRAGAV